jgi:hypothetical protein
MSDLYLGLLEQSSLLGCELMAIVAILVVMDPNEQRSGFIQAE